MVTRYWFGSDFVGKSTAKRLSLNNPRSQNESSTISMIHTHFSTVIPQSLYTQSKKVVHLSTSVTDITVN